MTIVDVLSMFRNYIIFCADTKSVTESLRMNLNDPNMDEQIPYLVLLNQSKMSLVETVSFIFRFSQLCSSFPYQHFRGIIFFRKCISSTTANEPPHRSNKLLQPPKDGR